MEWIKRRCGVIILGLCAVLLLFGWLSTITYYADVVAERDAEIAKLEQRVFESQKKNEELIDGVKNLKDSVFKVYLTWRRTRKVELNDSNFYKYYVGLKMAPFFRFDEKIWELIKAYNEVFYLDY